MVNRMPAERHEHLVKCAEEVIGLMNVGVNPDDALLKVARSNELTENEVDRVSHAVNNSKTVSVLQNESAEDKSKPFPLTNADKVKTHLYDGESKAPLGKKADLSGSYRDRGSYLDAEPVDHAADLRDHLGVAGVTKEAGFSKHALYVDDNLNVTIENEGAGRSTTNPYHKLGHLKHRIDEASAEFTRCRDAALNDLDKIGNELRRPDAPSFGDIEKLAQHMGAKDETITLVYEQQGLEHLGHRRSDGVKLAGLVQASSRAKGLADAILRVETALDQSSDCLAVRDLLKESYARLDDEITKQASAVGDMVEKMPEQLSGGGVDSSKNVALMGSVFGNTPSPAGDKGKPDGAAKSMLGVNARQDLANLGTRGSLEELLADPYIGSHPLQDVVATFNKVKGVNPSMSSAELGALVRQALAGDGSLPFDTLARARKTSPQQG